MQVVILCGGKGTRSYPFTDFFPKVMMPIGGRPILVHLMHIYASQGVKEFVLAAGHRQEILVDYFAGRFSQWQVRIVDTGEDSDTGERLRRCAPFVSDPFFATYGDGLGNVDLSALLNYHHSHPGVATVTAVPLRSNYGTLTFDAQGQVNEFQEKPVIQGRWINAGYFAFDRSVFDSWSGTNLELHVLPKLAENGLLYSYRHEGFWKSMDSSKDQQEIEKLLAAGQPPWEVRNGPSISESPRVISDELSRKS